MEQLSKFFALVIIIIIVLLDCVLPFIKANHVISTLSANNPLLIEPSSSSRRVKRDLTPDLGLALESRPTSPVISYHWHPNVTRYGDWSPDWSYCTGESFIGTIRALYTFITDNPLTNDAWGISRLHLLCHDLGGTSANEIIIGESNPLIKEEIDETITCPSMANGLELKQMPEMGCQDDLGLVNIKMMCTSHTRKEVQLKKSPELNLGQWTGGVFCPPLSAICGVKPRFDKTPIQRYNAKMYCYSNETTATDTDDTGRDAMGLTNLAFACCSIQDPSLICKPKIIWEEVKDCSNTKRCNFFIQYGSTYDPELSEHQKNAYEFAGLIHQGTVNTLITRFKKQFQKYFSKMNINIVESLDDLPVNRLDKSGQFSQCTKKMKQLVLTCVLPGDKANKKPPVSLVRLYLNHLLCE